MFMKNMDAVTSLMNTTDISSVQFRVIRDAFVVMCSVNSFSQYIVPCGVG